MQVWVLILQVFIQVGSVSTLGQTCFVTAFAQWCFGVNGFTVLICFKAKVIPYSTSHSWFIYQLLSGGSCSSCHSLPAPVSLSLSLLYPSLSLHAARSPARLGSKYNAVTSLGNVKKRKYWSGPSAV